MIFYHLKNIKIVNCFLEDSWIIFLETVLYYNSPYFTEQVAPLNGGFMFVAFGGAQINHISLLLLIFIICCMSAYCCDENPHELIWILLVSAAALSVLAQETPNWLIMMLPYYAVLIANLSKEYRRFFIY